MRVKFYDLRTLRLCAPDGTRLVLQVTFLGALFVALCSAAAAYVVAPAAAILVLAVLVLIYGATVTILTRHLVRSVNLWLLEAERRSRGLPVPELTGADRSVNYVALRLAFAPRMASLIGTADEVVGRFKFRISRRPTVPVTSQSNTANSSVDQSDSEDGNTGRHGPRTRLLVAGTAGLVVSLAALFTAVSLTGEDSNPELPPASGLDAPSGTDLAASNTVTLTFTVVGSNSPAPGGTGLLDTGISVKPDMKVTVTATGQVSCVAAFSWCSVGPDGDSTAYTSAGAGFPLPDAPAWGLIAKVGSTSLQFTGSRAGLAGTGNLMLGINDNYPADNVGSFAVTVSYVP